MIRDVPQTITNRLFYNPRIYCFFSNLFLLFSHCTNRDISSVNFFLSFVPSLYLANIHSECWVLHKARRPIDGIQPYLITNMSINSRRALAILRTRSPNLDIKVSLWNPNQPKIKACKVCKEGLPEDDYHLLFLYALHIVQFVKGVMTY